MPFKKIVELTRGGNGSLAWTKIWNAPNNLHKAKLPLGYELSLFSVHDLFFLMVKHNGKEIGRAVIQRSCGENCLFPLGEVKASEIDGLDEFPLLTSLNALDALDLKK